MADPRFFTNKGPFSIKQLADETGTTLSTDASAAKLIKDVAPIEQATHDTVTFLTNHRYAAKLKDSGAAACITDAKTAKEMEGLVPFIISDNPYYTYAQVARMFYPDPAIEAYIAPTAAIHPSATIGEGCRIESGAVVEENAIIGADSLIGANSVIGRGVTVGKNVRIFNQVSVAYAVLGDGVTLHPGVRIGQDGFGFATYRGAHVRVPQLGRVIIGNFVDIGSNTTIDRGAGPDTIIGDGTMIDNLVQIGHNVQTGRGCVIVSHAGIAGSAKLGDYVVLGGQVGIAGHITIASGVQIAAQSGVIENIPAGEQWGGSPAVPIRQYHRQTAYLRGAVKKKKQEG